MKDKFEWIINNTSEPLMLTEYGRELMDVYRFLQFLGLSGAELEKAICRWLEISDE